MTSTMTAVVRSILAVTVLSLAAIGLTGCYTPEPAQFEILNYHTDSGEPEVVKPAPVVEQVPSPEPAPPQSR